MLAPNESCLGNHNLTRDIKAGQCSLPSPPRLSSCVSARGNGDFKPSAAKQPLKKLQLHNDSHCSVHDRFASSLEKRELSLRKDTVSDVCYFECFSQWSWHRPDDKPEGARNKRPTILLWQSKCFKILCVLLVLGVVMFAQLTVSAWQSIHLPWKMSPSKYAPRLASRDGVRPNDLTLGNESNDLGFSSACDDYAKNIQEQLRLVLGPENPGPIIVGGIGDSGTRAVQMLLSKLGVDMGHYRFPGLPDSVLYTYDALMFMASLELYNCNGSTREIKVHSLYTRALERTQSIGYSKDEFGDPNLWQLGIQFVSNISLSMLQLAKEDKKVDPKLLPGLFGFKHPRTALVLPFFKAALGKQFKFFHVIRDGRDVANGRNLKMFRGLCQTYTGVKCPNSLPAHLEFWARMNLDIAKWAITNLEPDQYYVLRIEDVIQGNMACLDAASKFLSLPDDVVKNRITEEFVREEFRTHAFSYEGRKWSLQDSIRFTESAKTLPLVSKAMEAFGYALNSTQPWKRSISCLDLMPTLRTQINW